jgi:hypothetical protein
MALISAGVMLGLWAAEYFQVEPEIEPEPSILEKFNQSSAQRQKNIQEVSSPLMQQAEAFALYLNPPAPPKPEPEPAPVEKKQVAIQRPDVRPVQLSPKFELHGISYYRSKPEASMALVWEPGSGYRWIKQREKLGHFVVEQVKSTSIVYRDGQRTHEMAFVPGRTSTRVARENNHNSTPEQTGQSDRRESRPAPPRGIRRTPPTRVSVKNTSS